jgi:hypothetical protein
MGVLFRLALGVVFTMNGRPFLGDHARRQPQPEPEEMTHGRMQLQSPVSLGAMEKNSYPENSNVSK